MTRLPLLALLPACALGNPPGGADLDGATAPPDARELRPIDAPPGTPPPPDDAAPPPPDAVAEAHEPVDWAPLSGSFGGLGAYLHVPAGMGVGEPRPLVIVLHGCWEDAAVHAANSGWGALADARRLYLVHVEEAAQIQQCVDWWSLASQSGAGDAAGVVAMIDAVAAAYDVDADRVYLAGFSSGAALVVNLLAVYPERFAGGIVHAALPFAGYTGTDVGTLSYIFTEHDETPAARAAALPGDGPLPPVIAFVGATDATVHPTYTRELVEQWTAGQGADQTPELEGELKPGHATHTYRRYHDDAGRLLIATVTIVGMSHGYAVNPDGAGADAGGAASASLPGKPVYGKDVDLWAIFWAAQLLGL